MSPKIDSMELSAGRFALLFASAFLIAALPVLLVAVPPLFDYPDHLARMHILAEGEGGALSRYYAVVWAPIPDLAMDAVVPALARIMPLAAAGKAFILMVFLLIAGGVAALHRVLFRRWSAWPCLAFLLLYNRMLLWGFLNFLCGVGLALGALAAWIGLRERAALLRLAVAVPLTLIVFLAHLFAFGAFGLAVAAYELGRLWRAEAPASRRAIRELTLAALPFLLPLALLLAPASPAHSGGITFSRAARKLDLIFTIVDNYSLWFDGLTLLLLAGLLVGGFLRRRIAVSAAMAAPLAALALAELVMPNTLFGATGVDHRMPVVFALVLVAATRGVAGDPRRARRLAAGLALLFIARMAVVTATWLAYDRETAPLVAALGELPRGARLAIAHPATAIHVPRGGPPMAHLPALAVVASDAFVPRLFAFPGQQPIVATPAARALAEAADPAAIWAGLVEGDAAAAARVAPALARYDYVVFVADAPFTVPATPLLEARGAFARARLFAVRGAAGQGGSVTPGGG